MRIWMAACAFAVCAVAPASASAYELRQTSQGAFVRWQDPQVTFVVDSSLDKAAHGATDAVVEAIAAWNGQGGGPHLVAQRGSGATGPANDGQNTILYMPDGYPPAGNALAVTVSTLDETTGDLVDTDIVINGRYAFAVLSERARSKHQAAVSNEGGGGETDGSFDLEHVVSHELGHALGLADVYNDDHAVMYAYTAPEDASGRAPSEDDLKGLDSLYGGSSKRAGCGQACVGGSAAGGWASALMVVAACAAAIRRRRG
ncbi:MAG TPA: matrixin family metalloprotease [Polyangiaceae bacterium]